MNRIFFILSLNTFIFIVNKSLRCDPLIDFIKITRYPLKFNIDFFNLCEATLNQIFDNNSKSNF
jgi:hypothetical protein